jgi:hypothetical protein
MGIEPYLLTSGVRAILINVWCEGFAGAVMTPSLTNCSACH